MSAAESKGYHTDSKHCALKGMSVTGWKDTRELFAARVFVLKGI